MTQDATARMTTAVTNGATPRRGLAHVFDVVQHRGDWPLRDVVARAGEWHPYPVVTERTAWEAVPPERARPVVARAEAISGTPWPSLPATLYAEFRRNGDRERFQRPNRERRERLASLVLAECLTGEGRFLDDVVNGIWAICEETSWCVPAHSYATRFPGTPLPDPEYPVVDLFAAETGMLLAWTSYLLAPSLNREFPVVVDRIRHEADRRLLTPYRSVDDWTWLRGFTPDRGPNNWNPWIHSNLLTVTLLLEEDQNVRAAMLARAVRGLDEFLGGYADDGACDEGASYWWRAGASLFECLELLRGGTGGRIDGFQLPLVRAMGRYYHRMHIGGRWYVNFSDGQAQPVERGELLYRFGKAVDDDEMVAHALAMRGHQAAEGESLARRIPELLDHDYAGAPAAGPPLVRDTWLPGGEVLTCRQAAGTTRGLFLAAKGAHNGESHNHNDVGSFVVALDGSPVLIDAGVGVYTRKTFSADRYSIWTMQSAYHNLPLIDGHQQAPGESFRARDVVCEVADAATSLRMDLAGAYPAEAGVERWLRSVRLDRAGEGRVVAEDAYRLDHAPREMALHLMSWPEPDATMPGRLVLATPTRPLAVVYDADALEARVEKVEIDDSRLAAAWGLAVYRTVLSARHPAAEGAWELEIMPA